MCTCVCVFVMCTWADVCMCVSACLGMSIGILTNAYRNDYVVTLLSSTKSTVTSMQDNCTSYIYYMTASMRILPNQCRGANKFWICIIAAFGDCFCRWSFGVLLWEVITMGTWWLWENQHLKARLDFLRKCIYT